MVRRLQAAWRDYPVQQYFGDYLHATQNKAKEWADLCGADRHVCTPDDGATATNNGDARNLVGRGVNSRLNRFVDHFVRPPANARAAAPPFDVTAALYVCKANASPARPLDQPGERFTEASFDALAPNELALSFAGTQRTTNVVAQRDHATQADPVANALTNGSSCPTTTTPPPAGAAAYQTAPLPRDVTMIGIGQVTYRYRLASGQSSHLQLNTRLYDVAPDGRATLIDRGVKRLSEPQGETTYALHGQAWRFERGHAIRIEATQDDEPFVRRSNTPSSLEVAGAELRLPVRETAPRVADAPVGRPGTTPGRPGRPAPSGGNRPRCAPDALERVAVRPRGRGLAFRLPDGTGRLRVSVFQQSMGREVIGNRLVARFTRGRSFTWRGTGRRGRRLADGVYMVRLQRGRSARRVAVERRRGRFVLRPRYAMSPACGPLALFKLERPLLGGRRNRALGIAFRLRTAGDATITISGRGRTIRTLRRAGARAGTLNRFRLGSERVPRGNVRVVLRVRSGDRTTTYVLAARRL